MHLVMAASKFILLQIFYKNALKLGDQELNLSREKLIEKVNDICKNK